VTFTEQLHRQDVFMPHIHLYFLHLMAVFVCALIFSPSLRIKMKLCFGFHYVRFHPSTCTKLIM